MGLRCFGRVSRDEVRKWRRKKPQAKRCLREVKKLWGAWQAKHDSAFTRVVEDCSARHRTIPLGAHRFQADVEIVHSIMENEFYIERFKSRRDFIRKAAVYQNFFNCVRKNSGKENKCPFDLIRERDLNTSAKILHLPPVYLNELLRPLPLPQGVHHVRTYPCF